MICKYPIILDGTKIGEAQLEKEGLYYRIKCGCTFPDSKPWRIKVCCANNELDLGVCVTTTTGRGLETKIPAKLLDLSDISFCACLEEKEALYTVCENEPFSQVSQLLSMRLLAKNGQYGLVFIR